MKIFSFLVIGILFSLSSLSAQTVPQTFSYQSKSAKTVSIAGSFNNWSASAHPFQPQENGLWSITIELIPNYYQYKLVVDGKWIADPANDWKINDGGDGFNSIIKVGNPPVPQRKKYSKPLPVSLLPEPVIDSHPEYVALYYKAWELAWNKIQHGTPENGFEPAYMDEGFNELIYQWDICFITSFGIYGRDAFPVMASLDNFYNKQRPDGYIQRVYWETTGKLANEPSVDEPMVNPPLFAWVEWRYYEISGDASRLKRVLPVLTHYFEWTEKNCRTEKGKGLFYTSELGSGMDNTPRKNVGKAGWIDYSAQQVLAATCISKMASVINDDKTKATYQAKAAEINQSINAHLWDKKSGFYYDLTESGKLSTTMHIGAFWTLLAGVCPPERKASFLAHLKNPAEFWRPNLVPTLAANQPEYDPKGHYWLGSVWAPTNYMVIKGLESVSESNIADSISRNFLENVSGIYQNFKPDPEKIAFDERYADEYKTLWECYSSELNEPATRWDNTFYSRQDFVGWTGLAPISLLIENVLGFDISGKENTITWTIKRSDRHGLKNIRLKDQVVSLLFEKSGSKSEVMVTCEKPFTLNLSSGGKTVILAITDKESRIKI
ncbi:MAG: hypothetical protein J0L62_05770 [Bacteroidetes bacterium]|nr:hypothetical protein [Bacteroidota bacterium]